MKKFLFLVLACTMMIGLAGFGVAATTFDVNREFELEFHAVGDDGYAVEGVQIFLYREGVAILGDVTTNANGVAAVTAVNQGANFSVRFVAPEGFEVYGDTNRIDFVPVELVDVAMLGADGFYEGVLVKQLFFVVVEVEADEDADDEDVVADEDYDYDYDFVDVDVVPVDMPVATPIAAPTPVVVTAPVVVDAETVAAWPISLFAFVPAW